MSYTIVEFTGGRNSQKDMAIVCDEWIEGENRCWWPPYSSQSLIQNALLTSEPVGSTWRSYSTRILPPRKMTYERAQERIEIAELTSDLGTDYEDTFTAEKSVPVYATKSKRKRPPPVHQNESSDEGEKENLLNPPAIPLTSFMPLAIPLNSFTKQKRPTQSPNGSSFARSTLGENRGWEVGHTLDNMTTPKSASSSGNSDKSLLRATNKRAEMSVISSRLSPPEMTQSSALCPASNKKIALTPFEEHVLKKLEQIKQMICHLSESSSSMILTENGNCQLSKDLPLNTMDDYDALEERLLDDNSALTLLVKELGVLGGSTTTKTTWAVCSAIFTTDLSRKFNWTGQNGKGGIKNSKILEVIKGAVCRNRKLQNVLHCDIEAAAKRWFKNSFDRDGGRQLRNKKKSKENSPDSQPENQPND